MNYDTSFKSDYAFVAAWGEMEKRGYLYSKSNIEKVHLGWLMARAQTSSVLKLTMPNGDILECDYPKSGEWAKSWSIRYPDTGQIGTTGEQDLEVVERYGLTAILNAVLGSPPE